MEQSPIPTTAQWNALLKMHKQGVKTVLIEVKGKFYNVDLTKTFEK